MDRDERLVYWDSCCFTHFIENDPGKADLLESLLLSSGNGGFQIVTSALSIAEVAFVASERGQLNDVVVDQIEALWADTLAVRIAEFHEGIARATRDLLRECASRGWTGLRSADAIHLTTAKLLGAAEIHTYDSKWLRYAEIVGIPIGEPTTLQANRVTRPPERKVLDAPLAESDVSGPPTGSHPEP